MNEGKSIVLASRELYAWILGIDAEILGNPVHGKLRKTRKENKKQIEVLGMGFEI